MLWLKTEVQNDKRGTNGRLYQVFTQKRDTQPGLKGKWRVKSPQLAGKYTQCRTVSLSRRVCVCTHVCVSVALAPEIGSRREMRHCIKLWTSVSHRNRKAGAEEIERVTLTLFLSSAPFLSTHTCPSLNFLSWFPVLPPPPPAMSLKISQF